MDEQIRIETARLILKTVTLGNVAGVVESWNLEGDRLARAEAEAQITRMLENHRQNRAGKIYHLCLAIVEKETGAIIGWCGLDHRDPAWANPALFYLVKSTCWGRGYATEAAMALLQYAFETFCIPRIDSACVADNLASKRVMEKLGMQFLGRDESGGYRFTLVNTPPPAPPHFQSA